MSREDFEELADQAWQSIPQSFRDRFSNVAVFVEQETKPADLHAARVPLRGTLLGLYQGVPLSRRGHRYGMVLPDKVMLFQGPIERSAERVEEIPQIICDTLWHELAHHLGMNENQVRNAENRRGKR